MFLFTVLEVRLISPGPRWTEIGLTEAVYFQGGVHVSNISKDRCPNWRRWKQNLLLQVHKSLIHSWALCCGGKVCFAFSWKLPDCTLQEPSLQLKSPCPTNDCLHILRMAFLLSLVWLLWPLWLNCSMSTNRFFLGHSSSEVSMTMSLLRFCHKTWFWPFMSLQSDCFQNLMKTYFC